MWRERLKILDYTWEIWKTRQKHFKRGTTSRKRRSSRHTEVRGIAKRSPRASVNHKIAAVTGDTHHMKIFQFRERGEREGRRLLRHPCTGSQLAGGEPTWRVGESWPCSTVRTAALYPSWTLCTEARRRWHCAQIHWDANTVYKDTMQRHWHCA